MGRFSATGQNTPPRRSSTCHTPTRQTASTQRRSHANSNRRDRIVCRARQCGPTSRFPLPIDRANAPIPHRRHRGTTGRKSAPSRGPGISWILAMPRESETVRSAQPVPPAARQPAPPPQACQRGCQRERQTERQRRQQSEAKQPGRCRSACRLRGLSPKGI